MLRYENWPEILAEEIEGARERPFSFGSHDCTAFAMRVVRAMTGRDHMAAFPAYASEDEAAEILAARGGLAAMATQQFGAPVAVAYAQRGDLVLLPTPRGDALGICLGSSAVFAAPLGVSIMAMQHVVAAWSI